MDWIQLNNLQQLQEIKLLAGYSVVFKHSTRCSVSMMARKRLEMDSTAIPESIPLYFLDLLAYRNISNAIAEEFQVPHESPQILLIKDGECIYESSHSEISADDIAEQITDPSDPSALSKEYTGNQD